MSTFLAVVFGAVVGAIATGTVTYYTGPRIEERIRRRERTERALENILEVLETDHWDRINAYRDEYEGREEARTTLLSASDETARIASTYGDERLGNISRNARELILSVRRLRLFASRVEDKVFSDAFGRYFTAMMMVDVVCRLMPDRQGNPAEWVAFPPADDLSIPLRELLRRGKQLLGCEWWDPDDISQFLRG